MKTSTTILFSVLLARQLVRAQESRASGFHLEVRQRTSSPQCLRSRPQGPDDPGSSEANRPRRRMGGYRQGQAVDIF